MYIGPVNHEHADRKFAGINGTFSMLSWIDIGPRALVAALRSVPSLGSSISLELTCHQIAYPSAQMPRCCCQGT